MRTIIKTPALKSLFDANFYPANLVNVIDDLYGVNKKNYLPPVNVHESQGQFTLEFLVPGFKKEDLKIDLDDKKLTVSAEHTEEQEKTERNFVRKEFNYQSFKRSFTLPDNANLEAMTAKYENGILNVLIPKKVETRLETKKVIEIA